MVPSLSFAKHVSIVIKASRVLLSSKMGKCVSMRHQGVKCGAKLITGKACINSPSRRQVRCLSQKWQSVYQCATKASSVVPCNWQSMYQFAIKLSSVVQSSLSSLKAKHACIQAMQQKASMYNLLGYNRRSSLLHNHAVDIRNSGYNADYKLCG